MSYNPYAAPCGQPTAAPPYAGPSGYASTSYPAGVAAYPPYAPPTNGYPSMASSSSSTLPVVAGPVFPGYAHMPSPLPQAQAQQHGAYDLELAQQQSAYTPEGAQRAAANAKANQERRQKPQGRTTVLRKGGGQLWEDPSLMEWDPGQHFAHFRLFVGDLDPSLSEDQFREAFSGNGRYKSFVKSKIVRDKKTNKGKGYGFVSYSDPEDFLKAWKELNGKYVGTRPVKISKATAGVSAVNIGAKKAAMLDSKKVHKSGTVPYERAKLKEAEGGHMNKNSNGFGPQKVGKSYIRR
ncbi:BQ2448_4065 [Microbotryum intermedium]|uniref:BQ2448_4065 protein n=1 Tax=Microbotryum intermedium TaxID=269621 RepID=A0A238FMW2_9BASI|nr:BQ2448_4065 [Microbotryum intermedium]